MSGTPLTNLLILDIIRITPRKRKPPLSQDKLESLYRIKDFIDNKIREIESNLPLPKSHLRQNSLLLQRNILQSFQTRTLNSIAQLEKEMNYESK